MPNRILKDSICTSENLDLLSPGAEIFFYRLLVQCDDYGCFDARLQILRARCYPLRCVTDKELSKWLDELSQNDLIVIYTVKGKRYLQFKTWKHHQQIRAKKSKYPQLISDDINGNQLISNDALIQSNPIQSNPESNPSIAEPDKPKRAKREPNPLSSHPAIMAIRELTGKYPSEAIYQSLVDVIGETPDVEKLRAGREEWTKRGYNPNAFTWAIDWYRDGIPQRSNGNGHTSGTANNPDSLASRAAAAGGTYKVADISVVPEQFRKHKPA
jgi:hypothetical protein